MEVRGRCFLAVSVQNVYFFWTWVCLPPWKNPVLAVDFNWSPCTAACDRRRNVKKKKKDTHKSCLDSLQSNTAAACALLELCVFGSKGTTDFTEWKHRLHFRRENLNRSVSITSRRKEKNNNMQPIWFTLRFVTERRLHFSASPRVLMKMKPCLLTLRGSQHRIKTAVLTSRALFSFKEVLQSLLSNKAVVSTTNYEGKKVHLFFFLSRKVSH